MATAAIAICTAMAKFRKLLDMPGPHGFTASEKSCLKKQTWHLVSSAWCLMSVTFIYRQKIDFSQYLCP